MKRKVYGTAGESSLQKAFHALLLDWQIVGVRRAIEGSFVSLMLLIAQGHVFYHEGSLL
jgi:hypothetical protein